MDIELSEDKKDRETALSTRRVSHMSIEDPLSPASDSSDSVYEEEFEREFQTNQLRPQISRASSTNAVGGVTPSLDLTRTWTSKTSGTLTDPAFEVYFEDGEQGNPQNWPLWYKGVILAILSYSTTAVVLFSTSVRKLMGITLSDV